MVNRLINLLDAVGWFISRTFWSIYFRILTYLKGVKLGHNSKFYGFTKIKRATGSRIVIGENATFRSAPTSNLIGVNKPCILSTLNKEAVLTLGDNCGLSGTVIGCFKEITIGNNVLIGSNTLITDSNWHPKDIRSGNPQPVVIGNNVWLGVNVTVLKGIKIGDNAVIGAGSVVTKTIPANVVAAGNPCKVIRTL